MNFRFETPWLLAFLVLVLLAFAANVASHHKQRGGLLFPSVRLLPASSIGWRVRLAWIVIPMRLVALGLLVIALARPQIGRASFEVPNQGIDLVLALDTSFSMKD